MPETRPCAVCGTPLPPDAASGACAVCALQGALALGPPSVPALGARLRYFGDYELLGEIARGGMGVVYRARQLSLNRTVALKMILGGKLATPGEVRRFRAEAEAAASLQHPNIVAIHEVGEHEGQHYFSMDLVEGKNLAQLVRENPLPATQAAGYVRTIAEAIQFAHEHGVLHRDLKPSNVLVNAQEQPRITDFGLAKSLTGDSDLTSTGQVLGTPSFIPPEQIDAGRGPVGPPSDVYSLGAILYHLLTGRPPFVAETLETTLAQVLGAEPATPRLLNPSIPRDLETICLKCLEKDPSRRYPTARELADELGRFLRGEPIFARPIGRGEKLARWCRRNPAVAVLGAGVLLLLVASGIGASIFTVRLSGTLRRAEDGEARLRELAVDLSNALNKANNALAAETMARNTAETSRVDAVTQKANADFEKKRAEQALALATHALAAASNEWQRAEAEATEAKRQRATAEDARKDAANQWARADANARQLEGSMQFLLYDLSDKLKPIGRVDLLQSVAQRLSAYYGSLPAGRDRPATFHAFKILGHARALQGDSAGAAAAFTNALAVAEELGSREPANTNWQRERLLCHQSLGEIWQAQGNPDWALDEYLASLTIAQRLAAQQPAVMEWQRLCLANHVRIGDVFWLQGDKRRALTNHEAAVRIARRLAEHSTQSFSNLTAPQIASRLPTLDATATAWQRDLAASYSPTGPLLLQIWGWNQAYQGCTQGLAVAQALALQHPGDHPLQSHLAICHDNLGDVLIVTNRLEEARGHYEKAKAIRQHLAHADPANTDWQRDLLRSYFKLDRVAVAQSEKPKAAPMARLFLDAPFRTIGEGIWQGGRWYHRRVQDVFLGDQPGNSIADFQASTTLAQRLTNSDPRNAVWLDALAQSHSLMGDLYRRAGRRKEAVEECQEALRLREGLAARDTNALEPQLLLALAHGKLAAALERMSQEDEALAHARTNLEVFVTLIGRWPRNFLLQEGPRAGQQNIGSKAPLTRDQVTDFGAAFSDGFAQAGKRARKKSASAKDLRDWAGYCLEKAVAETFFGDLASAADYTKSATQVWQAQWRDAPDDADCRAHWRQAMVSLGVYQICNRQFQAAADTARRGLELEPTSVDLQAILVLSYCLTGQSEKAQTIVRQNRGLSVGHRWTFPEAVLEDLHQLRAKGLTDLEVERIEERWKTHAEKASR